MTRAILFLARAASFLFFLFIVVPFQTILPPRVIAARDSMIKHLSLRIGVVQSRLVKTE